MDALVDGERLVFGDFRLESRSGRLFRRDSADTWVPVPIGSRAIEILRILISHPGVVVSKDVIMDAVWPDTAVELNNLTVQISALRRVLDEGRDGESCIQTIPGRGYRFVLGVAQDTPDAPPDPSPQPAARLVPQARQVLTRRWRIAAAGAVTLLLFTFWEVGWLSSVPTPHRLSLVVLPFTNLSGDARDDYLADAVTGDLTSDLSHIPGSFVVSRETAATYQGKAEDIRKIGRDLAVRFSIRGSVQRLGQVLRVNVELSSTETGAQLWSDRFDQRLDDLAAGQEVIVVRMRSALNISITDIEAARSLRERPTNPDAFDFILRARAINLQPRTKDTTVKVARLYEQALALDPNAVMALTGATFAVLNVYFLEGMPYDAAMEQAVQYLGRAQALEPNSELVLLAQLTMLDFQQNTPDYRLVRSRLAAVSRRLIERYPNNPEGYFHLGVVRRNEGKYDEAAAYFTKTIQLSPRDPNIKNFYWNMAFCRINAGHDLEGLKWADRAMTAEGSLPSPRERLLLSHRVVAYFRTGDVDTAKRLAAELNKRYPFDTWRMRAPSDPYSATEREQFRSIQEALKAAGSRDHLDPDADFGVAPDEVLHDDFQNKTPTTAPGVTTLSTEQLAAMLETERPLVIDTMDSTWYRSVPGAIGIDFHGNTHGTFTDRVQSRLEQKLHALTGGDTAKRIVALGSSVARFDGYNLASRIRHAGYTNVYWYRGGREAWEVAGKPEDEVLPADW